MGMFSKLNESLDMPAQRHPLRPWHWLLLLLLIAGTVYVILENPANKGKTASQASYLKCEGNIFGTIYHMTYLSSTDLSEGIDSVLQDVDTSLSPFNPNSVITAINNGTSMSTDEHFCNVFRLAKTISAETDGAFDITVAPLVNAWGFGFKNRQTITDSLIQSLLTHVGIDKVELNARGEIEKADTAVMLDMSAIAKGYGVDAVGLYLESMGVDNYMVEIGGEVRVRGNNHKGNPWNIGIMRPEADSLCQQTEIEQVISVTDISMATSGNYRNFYEEGGRRYAHTIDPHTGRPVQHTLLSATVLASDCATADAYATAFMVMGLKRSQQLLHRHPELQAYLIYSDDTHPYAVWQTDNIPLQSK